MLSIIFYLETFFRCRPRRTQNYSDNSMNNDPLVQELDPFVYAFVEFYWSVLFLVICNPPKLLSN